MPVRPTDAMHWYYRVFKAEVETSKLLQNNPTDWTRLQVWDGTSLKPAMPDGFSGVPNEEQINMLYSHVQNKQLFFFELGNPAPQLLTANGPVLIPKEPTEPVPPPPLTITDPKKEAQQRKDHAASLRKHEELLQKYHTAQEMHRDHPAFQAAVDEYNAGRDLSQDSMELKSRNESESLQRMKNSREKAERVITQMMAPRPSAPPDVFYRDEKHSSYATISYQQFNDYLEPGGYDLPKNSKVDDYDAATINFAMMGVVSEIEKIFNDRGDMGPVFAKSRARESFHFMVTGLFGYTRFKQPMTPVLGNVMKMGQTAIEAYNAGDPTLLGQRLSETVRNIKQFFTGTGQYFVTESLTAASKLTERLLGLFERKPDIWEATGLTEQDRDFMRGYVQIGKIYDKYADSQIKFNDAFFKGTQLSPEENAEILADAVIRKMVENELKKDSEAAESKPEFEAGLMEAMAKDLLTEQKLNAWIAENKKKFKTQGEFDDAMEKQQRLLDFKANITLHSSLPCEHPIIAKLSQPGMLERLRQNLMKDPAILEQANKSPMEFKPDDLTKGRKLGALINSAEQLVDLSQAQAAWNEKFQAMLIQAPPSFAPHTDRLMIAQTDANGVKTMVSLSSLLEGGPLALQDPKSNALDLLYENAKNGNLYFRSTDQAIPTLLNADGGSFSAQPMQRPTLWMRFANTITFGWAYAKECEAAAAYDNYVKAKQESEAAAQNTQEVPQPEAEEEQLQQEQPQQELIKPWKYQAIDTRNMTNDDFLAHVEAAIMRGSELSTENTLANYNITPESYFEAITQQLEAQVAKNIRDSVSVETGEERNQILEAYKKNYTAMVVGLGDYVFNHTNKEALAAYCINPEAFTDVYSALHDSADEIVRTGVLGYTTQLNQENATKEQAKQQEQPNKEATLENSEPQPQKEGNPLGMG